MDIKSTEDLDDMDAVMEASKNMSPEDTMTIMLMASMRKDIKAMGKQMNSIERNVDIRMGRIEISFASIVFGSLLALLKMAMDGRLTW